MPDFSAQRRLRIITTKLAVLTFRISCALFESDFAGALSRLGQTLRTKLSAAGRKAKGTTATPTIIEASASATQSRKSSGPNTAPTMPIMFIHKGNKEHLKYALAQARQSNPDSRIFLLGDASNNATVLSNTIL